MPGCKVTIKDNGAYGLIAVQGSGWIGKQRLQTPAMIRFGELTEDEVFVSYDAARDGVVFDNTGTRAAGDPALLRPGHQSRRPPMWATTRSPVNCLRLAAFTFGGGSANRC